MFPCWVEVYRIRTKKNFYTEKTAELNKRNDNQMAEQHHKQRQAMSPNKEMLILNITIIVIHNKVNVCFYVQLALSVRITSYTYTHSFMYR